VGGLGGWGVAGFNLIIIRRDVAVMEVGGGNQWSSGGFLLAPWRVAATIKSSFCAIGAIGWQPNGWRWPSASNSAFVLLVLIAAALLQPEPGGGWRHAPPE
jgi:hypothetical protein